MSERGLTPRALARAETLTRIKELALGQLASAGAGELSLRAIARELNIVSSAIYRYYPSRDDLITDLILDGYTDLAATLHAAGAGAGTPRERWVEKCHALRVWAVEQPHRFALIYGSAIPGYAAPATTIEPAGEVVRALFDPVARAGETALTTVSPALRRQASTLQSALSQELTPELAVAIAATFAQLIGTLTLELGGHFVGTFDPAEELYAELVDRQAGLLGLPS